jgi:CHAT domain-containing protein/Tfp pilus assembly protein PilF
MTGANSEEISLRAYLLGELTLDEQTRIEERLLLDSDYVDLLEIIEDELIDSYLRDTLSKRERKEFENHFVATPQGRRQLRMAVALRKYVNKPQPTPSPHPRPDPKLHWWQQLLAPAWRKAIFAMLMLALGVGIFRIVNPSLANQGRRELQAALRDSPIETRIAGFDWRPQPVTYGDPLDNVVDKLSLDRAERYLLDAVRSPGDSDSHHALGQFYLAKRDFDKAIERFTNALASSPKNARLHSDLGAALLERGKDSQLRGSTGSLDFDESLEHLDKALELDASLLPALFNRALCLEYMHLPAQAEVDWKRYLSQDNDSPWAEEAKRHLRDVQEKQQKTSRSPEEQFHDFLAAYGANDQQAAWEPIRQNRDITKGKLIWWQLLDEFFKSTEAGRLSEATESLRALHYFGNLKLHPPQEQGKYSGDSYFLELARFYQSSSPRRRATLAQAHTQVNEGNRLCSEARYEEAIERYVSAGETYLRLGDLWESTLTNLLIGLCQVQIREGQKSRSNFESVSALGKEKGYLWLRAEACYGLGRAHDSLGEHSQAIAYTAEALQLSERIDDGYNAQRSLSMIADQYRKLGNNGLSLENLNRCLATITKSGWPGDRQMIRNCNQLMQVLNLKGLYAAATAYGNEALRLALKIEERSFVYLLYVHLGLISGKRQNFKDAIELAEHGLEAANAIRDDTERRGYLAYTSLQLGNLHRQAGDCDRALAHYDQAIELSSSTNPSNATPFGAAAYGAHKGKLFCHIAQKNDAETEAELSVTLDLLEKNRKIILEEQNVNTFFDAEQSVYDAAIDFQHTRRGDYQAVFDYSEQSNARWLLDLVATSDPGAAEADGLQFPNAPISHPLTLPEVQRRLPDQTQLIEYAVLDDKLLICLVSKSDFSVRTTNISAVDLANMVSNFRDSIFQKREASAEAQELYNLLIKPIELSPENGKQICIVPDKVLNKFPFVALVSPGSGRYLVQDYQLTLAPSAAVYLVCSERRGHTASRGQERLLAVGDPAFDRTAFRSLPRLPTTSQQIRTIADYYPSSVVLTDTGAKEEVIKREMEESDVIHLASHYVVYEGDPMNSRLLLAHQPRVRHESDNSDGSLQADEVYRLRLGRAPLAVLSACDSGVEHYYNSEGMIGLARAFIAAGAPVVVASLWQVEAHATDELMISFHRHRELEEVSSSEALRRAQVELLGDNSRKHPYYWAGFVTVGGQTPF